MNYEELVLQPEAKMREALRFLDMPADTDMSHFLSADGVKLGANHTIAGNPMRHESGWIPLRPDEAWRQKMSKPRQLAIAAMTFPLLRKYGYPVSPAD